MIKLGSNNIGKIYLGSSFIGKAYLGTNLVFQKGSQPQPVQTVAYIRGGADGSYIDTGITPDETMKVIVWARNFNPASTENTILFGSRDSDMTNCIQLFSGMSSNLGKIQLRFGDSTVYSTSIDFRTLGHYHKYELSSDGFFVDDTLAASISVSSMSNSSNLTLFKSNNAGTIGGTTVCPIDICACKIYKGGSLVRDFTAVNSPSVGLYDAVSDTVFTNAGGGSFTYGEFNKNTYKPLEYIECTGAQYFDSGIKGSNSLNYVVKFQNGGVSAWPELFFVQTSSSSKRYGIGFGNNTTPNSVVYFTFNATNKSYTYGGSFAGKDLVALKSGVDHYLYENDVQKTKQTHTAATFTTDYNIFVGSGNHAGASANNYTGRIYYLIFGAQRNFVPGKKGSRVGMYDTYNDVFYPSATNTPFIAGPTI